MKDDDFIERAVAALLPNPRWACCEVCVDPNPTPGMTRIRIVGIDRDLPRQSGDRCAVFVDRHIQNVGPLLARLFDALAAQSPWPTE